MPGRTPSQTVGPYLHIGLTGQYGFDKVTREQLEAKLFPEEEAAAPAAPEPKQFTFQKHYDDWVAEYTGIHSPQYLRKLKHVPGQLHEFFGPEAVAGAALRPKAERRIPVGHERPVLHLTLLSLMAS